MDKSWETETEASFPQAEYELLPDDHPLVAISPKGFLLTFDYIQYRLRKAKRVWKNAPKNMPSSPTYLNMILRTLCDEFEERYKNEFEDMKNAIPFNDDTPTYAFFDVCDMLFPREGSTRNITWGRIVALFAFGGAVAVRCAELKLDSNIGDVGGYISRYIDDHLCTWIYDHGGWDGLIKYYHSKPNEATWSFGGVMTGVGLACGAVGAVLTGAFLAGKVG